MALKQDGLLLPERSGSQNGQAVAALNIRLLGGHHLAYAELFYALGRVGIGADPIFTYRISVDRRAADSTGAALSHRSFQAGCGRESVARDRIRQARIREETCLAWHS